MRRRGRVDGPQRAIVQALRQAGASVAVLSNVGDGCPDLLVGILGRGNVLVEVKDGRKPPSERKLTPEQIAFWQTWRGPIEIVLSVDEALALVQATREA